MDLIFIFPRNYSKLIENNQLTWRFFCNCLLKPNSLTKIANIFLLFHPLALIVVISSLQIW